MRRGFDQTPHWRSLSKYSASAPMNCSDVNRRVRRRSPPDAPGNSLTQCLVCHDGNRTRYSISWSRSSANTPALDSVSSNPWKVSWPGCPDIGTNPSPRFGAPPFPKPLFVFAAPLPSRRRKRKVSASLRADRNRHDRPRPFAGWHGDCRAVRARRVTGVCEGDNNPPRNLRVMNFSPRMRRPRRAGHVSSARAVAGPTNALTPKIGGLAQGG